MTTHRSRIAAVRAASLAAAAVLLMVGCGTRVSDARVIAGVGGAAVSAGQGSDIPYASTRPNAGDALTDQPLPGASGPAKSSVGPVLSSGSLQGPATRGQGGGSTGAVPGPAGAAETCTSQGAPIIIGQVGSFSGLVGPVVGSARTGLAVWARDVNARGGIACHPVQVYAEDDASDAAKSSQAVRNLVQHKHAVALVGNFVPLSMAGFRNAVESVKVPAIGGDLVSPDWNQSQWLFPHGASVGGQVYGGFKQAVQQGHTKLGILYCVESSVCTNGYNESTKGGRAKAAGATVVYAAQVSLTATDYTAQCQGAKNAGADVLGLSVDGAAMARVVRSCAAIGYHPAGATVSGAIGAAQSNDSLLQQNTLSIASPVAPWTDTGNASVRAYVAAMQRYAPNQGTDGASISAWASGKLLEAALDKVATEARKGPVSTALILKGLGLIRHETLKGLIAPATFMAGRATPQSACAFYLLLKTGGWTSPRGSTPQC